MTRRLDRGTRLVVASHNPGKVREILDLVAPHGLSVVSAGELGLPEPEETGSTFAANARLKAVAAAQRAGLPALADDSGLEVEALGGAPGIYSARWAGPAKDFAVAMRRVADELQARGGLETIAGAARQFHCRAVPGLAGWRGRQSFEGKVYGHLVWPPRGAKGFGYDPMFVPDGDTLTFGEMEPDAKHAISHRARAFQLFAQRLPRRRRGRLRPMPASASTSTGRSAPRSAPTATSTAMCARAASTRRASCAPICASCGTGPSWRRAAASAASSSAAARPR